MPDFAVSSKDVTRLYLQAILSRGIVSEPVARLLHKKCIEAVNRAGNLSIAYNQDPRVFDAFAAEVGKALDPLEMEFRLTVSQLDGRKFYGIVNRKDDPISQLATEYSPNEIAFFKAVVERIMLAPDETFCVSSMAALREISHLKLNFTQKQGEVLLTSLVAKGWLHKSRRGRYTLATRSTLELSRYLQETYPEEYRQCIRCSEVLTRGLGCTNCKARVHGHCFKKYSEGLKKVKKTLACPECQIEWNQEDLQTIGEEAATAEMDEARQRRRRARTTDSDEEENAEFSGEEEDEDEEPIQKGEGKGKGKQRRPKVEFDDEAEMVNDEDDEDETPSQAPRRSGRRAH